MNAGGGVVQAVGKNVKSVDVGDPVLLSYVACQNCERCQAGHGSYCHGFIPENFGGHTGRIKEPKAGGEIYAQFFGQSSFAHHSIVAEGCVVNAKDLIKSEEELGLFAPLGCGFQTGAGVIQNISNAGAEDAVLIVGLGAVGMGSVMVSEIFEKHRCKVDRV
jgi:Zn-dependent alcohol dehydrogenase